MRVVIDTNRLTDLFRGDAALADFLARCEEVWLPLFVLGEIRAGFAGGSRHPENQGLLRAFLAKDTVNVLLPSMQTADHYARIFVQLKRAGRPIPDNDLWIAAQVIEHDLTLVTRDRHFEHIPQILLA